MVAPPTRLLASSSAIRKALTIVSVWPFEDPVRGRLETILIVPLSAAPAAGDGLGEGDGEGDGPGTVGLAGDGLVSAFAAGFSVGLASVFAGAAGWLPPPPQAARKTLAPRMSETTRQVAGLG